MSQLIRDTCLDSSQRRRMGDSNFCISADIRRQSPANTDPTGAFGGRRLHETACSDTENTENCVTYCATQIRALHLSFVTDLCRATLRSSICGSTGVGAGFGVPTAIAAFSASGLWVISERIQRRAIATRIR